MLSNIFKSLHTSVGNISGALPCIKLEELSRQLEIGDLIFIRVPALPFKMVANATDSWTNHVGVVIDISGKEAMIGESTFPFSKVTSLSRFAARSESRRIQISRLHDALDATQKDHVVQAAKKRLGIFYDTGFNLHSKRQFCSRYVHEVLHEASGVFVGEIDNFTTLLTRKPDLDLRFWRFWYFGNIPWYRETISPASLLRSTALREKFNGHADLPTH